ncbi:MAG: pseudouridine-5'-phosphate glycosidase [Anaerolineae bacterium]|nr:pseudouridine-5'-phosphate glycosidase [Anaerolineae bacterium]
MNPTTVVTKEIQQALAMKKAIVALESAVITHGLPAPHNLETAQAMERIVRENGAIPGTTALINGRVKLGLTPDELASIAAPDAKTVKISSRDFGYAMAKQLNGGTTVAGTLTIAASAGVKVFATGGIGGVHRGMTQDVSNDLFTLASAPVVVVCSGAKAILDLPATLETLETYGVPVVGYRTDELPAFYSRSSGLKVGITADTPQMVAEIAQAHWEMGLRSGVVVAQPIPEGDEIPKENLEMVIERAINDAEAQQLQGAALTPYLLARVSNYTKGASLKANLALLRNNAELAARIAVALAQMSTMRAPIT